MKTSLNDGKLKILHEKIRRIFSSRDMKALIFILIFNDICLGLYDIYCFYHALSITKDTIDDVTLWHYQYSVDNAVTGERRFFLWCGIVFLIIELMQFICTICAVRIFRKANYPSSGNIPKVNFTVIQIISWIFGGAWTAATVVWIVSIFQDVPSELIFSNLTCVLLLPIPLLISLKFTALAVSVSAVKKTLSGKGFFKTGVSFLKTDCILIFCLECLFSAAYPQAQVIDFDIIFLLPFMMTNVPIFMLARQYAKIQGDVQNVE